MDSVVAIPLFILLFHRIEVYYTRAAQGSGVGSFHHRRMASAPWWWCQ